MRILFDQATPVPLRQFLQGHEVATAYQRGWAKVSNGELILLAEASGFEMLITTDQNIGYQQNLKSRKIAIMVLGSGNWNIIKDHTPRIVQTLADVALGSYHFIEFPKET